IDTFVDVCECPTNLNLLAIDPRKGTLCPPIDCNKKTIDTLVDICECPTDLNLLFSDPRKNIVCPPVDCTKKTIDTRQNVCTCPSDKDSQQYKDDPRTFEEGICASGSIHLTLRVIATTVVLPFLALFF
ncbi:MAG: hypothetical protein EZS28_006555, partial [Streblomastix strix]